MSKKKRPKQKAFNRGETYLPDQEESYDPQLRAVILEVVENQLRANDPPETRQTLERLLAAGYTRQEAVKMIGAVIVGHTWTMLSEQHEFDRQRYIAELGELS